MAMVRFEDVATRVNTREDRFITELTYYVGGDHIETGELKVAGRGVIREADLGPMFYFGFKPGDILFVTRNPHLRKCAMVDFPGICSEKTLVIATKDENVLSQKYLAAVMQSDDFWEFMEENKSGSVNYFVNWSTLADYEFDLPPIERQRELADLLWAANDLKEAYKKAIAASDEMLKAQFRKLFDNGEFPTGDLGSVCSIITGKSIPLSRENEGGPIAYVKVGDFNLPENDKAIVSSSRYVSHETATMGTLLPIHSIIFAKNGAAALSNKKRITRVASCIDMNIMAVWAIDSRLDAEYLYAFFENLDLTKYILVGAIPQFRPQEIEQIQIPLPPLSLQREFVAIAEKAETVKTALKKSIADLEQVMKGLING